EEEEEQLPEPQLVLDPDSELVQQQGPSDPHKVEDSAEGTTGGCGRELKPERKDGRSDDSGAAATSTAAEAAAAAGSACCCSSSTAAEGGCTTTPAGTTECTAVWFTHLILDCDGVMVDSERASCESLRLGILEVTGFDIPHDFPQDYVEVFGMDVRSCVAHYR
ncbi:hypothetical protein Agub_g8677, partial [Astrephomene gubernaculifera]